MRQLEEHISIEDFPVPYARLVDFWLVHKVQVYACLDHITSRCKARQGKTHIAVTP